MSEFMDLNDLVLDNTTESQVNDRVTESPSEDQSSGLSPDLEKLLETSQDTSETSAESTVEKQPTTQEQSSTATITVTENQVFIDLKQFEQGNIPYVIAQPRTLASLSKLFTASAKFYIADKVYADIPHLLCGDLDAAVAAKFIPESHAMTFVLPYLLTILPDLTDADYVLIVGAGQDKIVRINSTVEIVDVDPDDFTIAASNYIIPITDYDAASNKVAVNLDEVTRTGVGYYQFDETIRYAGKVHDYLKAKQWAEYPRLENTETLFYAKTGRAKGFTSIVKLAEQLKQASVFVSPQGLHLFDATTVYMSRKLPYLWFNPETVNRVRELQKDYLIVSLPEEYGLEPEQVGLPLEIIRATNIKLTEIDEMWMFHDQSTDDLIFVIGTEQEIEDEVKVYMCAILRL